MSFISSTTAILDGGYMSDFDAGYSTSDSEEINANEINMISGYCYSTLTMAGNKAITIYESRLLRHCLIVTSTPAVARRWIQSTRYFSRHYYDSHRFIAGVGVQWVRSKNFSPAAMLQICVGRRCLIYRLEHAARVPRALRWFLQSTPITLVGICNHSDATKLMGSRHHVDVPELLDLRKLVRRENGASMAKVSLEELVEECLGYEDVRLEPMISCSNWDDELLSFNQVRQATVDAYVSFEIGGKLGPGIFLSFKFIET